MPANLQLPPTRNLVLRCVSRTLCLLMTAGVTCFASAQEVRAALETPAITSKEVQPLEAGQPASALPVAPAMQAAEHPYLLHYKYDGTKIVMKDPLGSVYVDVDSWVYPAMLRLYALGYIDTAYLAARPWTRRSILHMLDDCEDDIRFDGNEEALDILDKLYYYLRSEPRRDGPVSRGLVYGTEQAYAGARMVGGTVLRDSWHLGQTFINDYGRPYSNGFNTYNGVAGMAEIGPFSLYVRGEYQHAPSYTGYTYAQSYMLSEAVDRIPYGGVLDMFGGYDRPQATIPEGPLPSQNNFRLLEAYLSGHLWGHEISFGRSDAWLGPGLGGAMAWSNNAENIYSFRINRVEPMRIPILSHLIGDIRYDFFIGPLKGHTYPRDPYIHSEIVAMNPTRDFQVSFQRSIIFGGENHEPVTLHTFLRGFFHTTDTTAAEKFSRNDPGARFSSVTFSYRVPFIRKYATLYADSVTHDDVFPISAPRRAGWRPGIYFPRMPFVPKLDFRVEATYTDYVTSRSFRGSGDYVETIQLQGYTNNGVILGDWIGREAKGGQAWLTYHLSGNEWISLNYLRKKNAKDFIPANTDPNNFIEGGTTQNIYRVDLVKRLTPNVELNAWYQNEHWVAPFYKPGQQGTNSGAFQLKWYPDLHTTAH